MSTIPAILSQAYRHHQAGNFQQAEQCYRQLLQKNPQHVDALHMLGLLAFQTGRNDVAQEYIGKAVRLMPSFAEAHCNLGNVLQQLGKLDEAIASWRRALRVKPHLPEVHCNLGLALLEQGKLEEAMSSLQQALRLRPNYPDAHNNMGNVFKEQGKLAQAAACYQQALQLKADYAQAYVNLGATLHEQGKPEEAVACYHQVLGFDPNYVEAHNNLGLALKELGRLDQAVSSLQRAVQLKPTYAEAHMNLGLVFHEQGQPDQAAVCYQQAVRLKPNYAEAQNNLANALKDQGQLSQAMAGFRLAMSLKPGLSDIHNNLGNALEAQGELEEALACFRQALRLKPDFVIAHDNLLFTMQYCQGITLAKLAEAHAEYERQHAAPLRAAWKPHDNVRDPEKKLRLGLVSSDFGVHPVGYFLIGALENLDRSQMEVACYSDRPLEDAMTKRFQAVATIWRNVIGLRDDKLAEQVRADQIDILVDLAGHTARNRLLMFARKPAPIQLTWAGYVGTTGLTAIDYLVADRFYIPPEAERYYCERVLRLPDAYVGYDPPIFAPPVKPLPALTSGQVTFGSFNNPTKMTPEVVRVWASILRRVPRSRLVLKYRGMSDALVGGRFTEMFAGEGIESDRLELLDFSAHAELLEHYNHIDIALDPFPYSGGLTTCEALWMGVPVVTCPGETFASRHSLSYLSVIGLHETICQSLSEYENCAVAMTGDLPRLAELRLGLRRQVAASPLCDGQRFAQSAGCAPRRVEPILRQAPDFGPAPP